MVVLPVHNCLKADLSVLAVEHHILLQAALFRQLIFAPNPQLNRSAGNDATAQQFRTVSPFVCNVRVQIPVIPGIRHILCHKERIECISLAL